jgi:hypothetical protein
MGRISSLLVASHDFFDFACRFLASLFFFPGPANGFILEALLPLRVNLIFEILDIIFNPCRSSLLSDLILRGHEEGRLTQRTTRNVPGGCEWHRQRRATCFAWAMYF